MSETADETEPTGGFRAGFIAGLKRTNVRKVRQDVKGAGKPFLSGYLAGFLVKVVLLVAGGYYGVDLGVLG